jgi:hypothetical protein
VRGIVEAYVHGVSTRSVDDLAKAPGADTGISKSEVSRICADLDEPLTAFRTRPLVHTRFPYVYLDATHCKARYPARPRTPRSSFPAQPVSCRFAGRRAGQPFRRRRLLHVTAVGTSDDLRAVAGRVH